MACFSTGTMRIVAVALLLCMSAVESSYAESEAHQAALARARRTHRSGRGASIRVSLRGNKIEQQNPTEDVEEWKSSGMALSSVMTKSQLELVGAHISAKAYDDKLHEVFNSGGTGQKKSRFIGGPGNEVAAEFIQKQLKDMGLEVWTEELEHTFDIKPYVKASAKPKNVFAKIVGSDLSQDVIVMGSHFDSVNWKAADFGASDAPGVDDNGSGTAAVLLAAQALAVGPKPRRTIIFAFFNGEEEGLVGSEQFAKKAVTGKYGTIKGAIILDEVAWKGRDANKSTNRAIFETVGSVPGAMTLVDTMAQVSNMGFSDSLEGFVVNRHGFGSDHISFLDHGMPALLLIERDDTYHADTWGHSAQDDFEHMGKGWQDYGARMTRLAVRTVASLASPKAEVAASAADSLVSTEVRPHAHAVAL
eukprot:gnl/TRDRNA2_/TRDRNA2_180185_c0_seq1.p1 gnl/TRDRNA2_/TRDRNA2_180185_c0~~gnl/TRDRNA2_/TRDRNA2_180185_c0_seq1.p1  ORF type:complete len:419 (+),score=100.17 gnl/TRDRNA2_/TRDRNA2_180185_c0_seq1:76-1332(+)